MTTRGMKGTSEYKSWYDIKTRCFNPNHKQYSNWGGRGITVCDSWRNSFENFLADMVLKPSPKHSIDRIDNNGNYSAENCKWSTPKEQANNRNSNRLITIACVTLTIAQWTKEMSFGESVIWKRLENGWSERDAVLTPVHTGRLITDGFKTRTIAEWTTKMGYGRSVIQRRLNLGWSELEAITIPIGGKRRSL